MRSIFRVLLPAALLAVPPARRADAQAVPPPEASALPPDTGQVALDAITAGRKTFHGQGGCFGCHGGQLQGGPIAPPLTGPKWRHIDGSFGQIIYRVTKGMPGTVMMAHPGGITDAQIREVANYIWAVSQGKAKP